MRRVVTPLTGSSRNRPVPEGATNPDRRTRSRRRAGGATSEDARPAFPVVGIGASAGGLEAFRKLLEALPADTGIAFVLIPHLEPTHASMMVDLLGLHTANGRIAGNRRHADRAQPCLRHSAAGLSLGA